VTIFYKRVIRVNNRTLLSNAGIDIFSLRYVTFFAFIRKITGEIFVISPKNLG